MSIPIVTITRLGLNIMSKRWHTSKFRLFSRFTVPSIAGKTGDNIYHFFLIDSQLSDDLREMYQKCISVLNNSHLIAVDTLSESLHLSAGSYHWISTQLISKMFALEVVKHPEEMFISLNLDDDDALATDYLEVVRETALKYFAENQSQNKRKSHLKHGLSGCVIDLPDGYVWNTSSGFVSEHSQESQFTALITNSISGLTIMSLSHLNWPLAGRLFGFKYLSLPGYRGWIYTRDVQSFSTTVIDSDVDMVWSKQDILKRFSVDQAFFTEYRSPRVGRSARQQRVRRSRILRIAILQQKIVAYRNFLKSCPLGPMRSQLLGQNKTA